MGRTSNVAIEASVDDKASRPMGQIAEATDDAATSFTELNSAAELVSKAWGAIVGAGGAVVDYMRGAVASAMEAEKAQRDLATSLRQHGGAVDELLPRLNDQASAIQAMTGISGDNVTALQAQLAALGVLPANLEAATTAAIGWSRTTGKDMSAAALDVVKVLNGKNQTLEKMGVKLASAQERLEYMAKGMVLAAAEGQSLEGRLNILTENWGDLEEAIGGAVSESEAASSTVSAVSATVLQLQQVFASPEGRAAVDSFFRALSAGASLAINAGLGALAFWEDEVIPRVNNARMFFTGEDVIAEALDPGAEAAKAKVRDLAENLANILEGIGKGKPVELPPIEAPKLPAIVRQKAEDDALAAAAAKAEAADDKAIEAALARAKTAAERKAEQARRAAEAERQDELARSQQIIALAEEVARRKAEIIEAEYRETQAREERDRRNAEAQAQSFVSMFSSAAGAVSSTWEASFSRVGETVDGVLVTRASAFADFLEDLGKQLASFLASRLVLAFLGLVGNALTGGALGGLFEFLGFAEGGPVKAMASGGPVSGGVVGRDSVPILGMDGEYMLNTATVDAIQRGVPPPATPGLPLDRYFGGGAQAVPVPVGGGGATINLHLQSSTLERQTDATFEAMVERQIMPAIMRALGRSGVSLAPAGWAST